MNSPSIGDIIQLHIQGRSEIADLYGRSHQTDVHVRDAPAITTDEHPSLEVEIIEAHNDHLIAEPTGHSSVFRTDDVRGTKNDLLGGHQ